MKTTTEIIQKELCWRYETEPEFRASIDREAATLASSTQIPLPVAVGRVLDMEVARGIANGSGATTNGYWAEWEK